MADSKAIEELMKEMRGSGFFYRATEARLRSAIDDLRTCGIPDEKIVTVVGDIWGAASSEYGE